MLRVGLLLAEGLMERSYTCDNPNCHERKGNKRPDNTPAARRATVSLSEDTGVGGVDFADDKVVALVTVSWIPARKKKGKKTYNIPDTVECRHHTDEQLSKLAPYS